jgi:AraC family transcriptional regulator of adaptative response/methylated-DNA-[protein]-cysteine methyltransferase
MSASLDHVSADYARVERAIRFIEENRLDQPGLDEVALAMGLSPSHAQRVFTRWVGISPKRLLGLLTVEHAKSLLRDASSVLDTTYEVGLSGPSRLHDLFVTFEAMTPGEYKALGAGLVLRWGVHPTPFGPAFIAVTDRGIACFAFLAGQDLEEQVAETQAHWPLSRLVRDQEGTLAWIDRCFPDGPNAQPLPLLVKGTPFQIQVWRALLQIPEGVTVTYGGIARAIGRPGAVRAVGSACGRNDLAYLIPCHRVVRDTGALGGYRWGLARKQAMLAWESARQGRQERAALLESA